jgi:hypothetical protein
MRSIDRRLTKLENRFGIAHVHTTYLVLLMDAGRGRGPAEEMYIKTLDDGGVLATGGFVVVDLNPAPEGLSAEEAKILALENAAKIRGAQHSGQPGVEGDGKCSVHSVSIKLEQY